jgi:hypothetical protein
MDGIKISKKWTEDLNWIIQGHHVSPSQIKVPNIAPGHRSWPLQVNSKGLFFNIPGPSTIDLMSPFSTPARIWKIVPWNILKERRLDFQRTFLRCKRHKNIDGIAHGDFHKYVWSMGIGLLIIYSTPKISALSKTKK